MKNRVVVMTMLVCLLALGFLFTTCDEKPKPGDNSGGPDAPDGVEAMFEYWMANDDGTTTLEERYYFLEDGTYFIWNFHPWKDDLQEEGTWTGSTAANGSIDMICTDFNPEYYGAGIQKGFSNGQFLPPHSSTGTILLGGQTLRVVKWDYAIKIANGNTGDFLHSGATTKSYQKIK